MAETGTPFSDPMGVEILEREKTRLRGRMVMRDDLCTAGGILHGGAYMAFADALGAIGGGLYQAAGTRTTMRESTIELPPWRSTWLPPKSETYQPRP